MARRGRHKKGGRVTPKGTRPPDLSGRRNDAGYSSAGSRDEPELIGDIRKKLRSGEPFDFLAYASSFVAASDPRQVDPFSKEPDHRRNGEQLNFLIGSFGEVDVPETAAMLAAIAELAPEELQRARARRHLAASPHPIPEWLGRLGEAEPYGAIEMVHVVNDGANVAVGVRLPGEADITVSVYIDHNLGRVAKDGFVVPCSLAEMVASMKRFAEDAENTEWRPLSLADARARVEEAVEHGERFFPRFETESWPASRPIVEWLVRRLPEGGSGYESREWDDEDVDALKRRIRRSPEWEGLDDAKHVDLLDTLLWYGTGCGPCDPFHWSSVVVEILLLDWIPRKIVAPSAELERAPEVMRALIRFAHRERGIPAQLTEETLSAVDRYLPEYREIISRPRAQGPIALLEQTGIRISDDDLSWPDDEDEDEDDVDDLGLVGWLARDVGGEEALENLSVEPLPDEEFVWDGIPDDIRGTVGQVLEWCDRCCDELFDVEFRTSARRLLSRAASGDPRVFRRKAKVESGAAAICWSVAKANGVFEGRHQKMFQKDLWGWFGVSPGNYRATTMMTAAGILGPHDYMGAPRHVLGHPELLVSAQRQYLVELRERYR